MSVKKDVIVVGGGLAGLAAAELLARRGRAVSLLEAQPRVGGRLRTGPRSHGYYDLGASFVGDAQHLVHHYILHHGLELVPTYLSREQAWYWQGSRGPTARFSTEDVYDVPGGDLTLSFLDRLNQLSVEVGAFGGEPWLHPDARALDSITVQEWMDREMPNNRHLREVTTVAIRAAFSMEPRQLSFLFMLHYTATAGRFQNTMGVTSNPQGQRLRAGATSLANAISDALLSHPNAELRRGTPVLRLVHDDAGVVAHTADEEIEAAAAIVAMSPPMSLQLGFEPALSASEAGRAWQALARGMQMGDHIKGFVHLRRPFWRDSGVNGTLLAHRGPVVWTVDCSWEPEDPEVRGPKWPYQLMFFIVGDAARYWRERSASERREAVLAQLTEVYGDALRSNLIAGDDYSEFDWNLEPWAGGGPAAMMGPGVLSRHGPSLRKPVGRIHFAASELATSWCGYMNGALQSGLRSAAEVEARLASA